MELYGRCVVLIFLAIVSNTRGSSLDVPGNCSASPGCSPATILLPRDSNGVVSVRTHYTVGVLAIQGPDVAYTQWNKTFNDYLTSEVGSKFDPPIKFSMIPLDFNTLYTFVDDANGMPAVDFIFVNPSAFSCIESEYGAASLVSMRNFRSVAGQKFELTEFGGIFFKRKDNTAVNSVKDLKDKRVAAASISGLGSGQAQFRVMNDEGLSFLNDPSQVVFTSNQGQVVNLVVAGKVDVGFVRTDRIETFDSQDKVDMDELEFIDTRAVTTNGAAFPFAISTHLYPEWNVGSLAHVNWEVQLEVQLALLKMNKDHPAAVSAKVAGWRPTLSYMTLRNMQDDLGYIVKEGGKMKCIRSSALYDAVVCPTGYFKKSREEVEGNCDAMGLECPVAPEGAKAFQCVCKPCVAGYEVEVIRPVALSVSQSMGQACSKMDMCGKFEQGSSLSFKVVDNLRRDNLNLSWYMHVDNGIQGMGQQNGSNWMITLTTKKAGRHILEVAVDDQQIESSPFFIEVTERDCDAEFGKSANREINEEGECVCQSATAKIGGKCIGVLSVLLPSILVPLLALFGVIIFFYLRHKQAQADSVWRVKHSDLVFDDPVEVLGRGTFGLVVKANYRGTAVAVKRVLPDPEAATSEVTSRSRNIFSSQASLGFAASVGSMSGLSQTPSEPGQTLSPGDAKAKFRAAALNDNASLSGSTASLVPAADNPMGSMIGVPQGGTGTGTGTMDSNRSGGKVMGVLGSFIKPSPGKKLRQDFMKEMRILSKLRHQCIVSVMGAVIESGQEPMLIMELMDHGSLYDLLHNDTVVIEGEMVLPVLKDLAQGLRFLHSADEPIIHGDIKAQNVLVDSKFRAKVADFGLTQKKKLGLHGTPPFMAPEILRGQGNSTATDVYAFAVVLAEVYSRKDPYYGEDINEVLKQVAEENRDPPKRCQTPKAIPLGLKQLMQECWNEDPTKRPNFNEIDRRIQRLDAESVSPLMGVANHKNTRKKDDLLYDVFPKHIADALANGQKVEPESRECVTIFFSDIVGFTNISSTLEPHKISQMLDRLYTAFDAISREHQVFKVETIGDAYMAVTNLVQDQENDHAYRIARFSLEAIEAARNTLIDEDDPSRGTIQIRVGFHSGPVVANVVGTRNPRYCLFGDTVNTASRMESNSEALKVHMSKRAAQCLREQAPNMLIKCRGQIEVKGKGKMTTYWLVGDRPDGPAKFMPRPDDAALVKGQNEPQSQTNGTLCERTTSADSKKAADGLGSYDKL